MPKLCGFPVNNGHKFLESMPQVKPYWKMLGARPRSRRRNDDRGIASRAMAGRYKKN